MKHILISIIMLIGISSIYAQDYAVVVSKGSSLTQVSVSDLKRLFTGKTQEMSGTKATPVNMSLDNPVSAKFILDITGMAVVDYKSFWMAEQVRGGSAAPKVIKTTEALITYITENPEAIGYMDKKLVTDAVKVVAIK
jgi:hypothetical protein